MASKSVKGPAFFIFAGGQHNNAVGGYTMRDTGEMVREAVRVQFMPTLPTVCTPVVEHGRNIANSHGQESVLYVDAWRNAYLIFAEGKVEYIGQFKQWHPYMGKLADFAGFTGFNGKTYVCIPSRQI